MDRFLGACLRGDRGEAAELSVDRLTPADLATLVEAADHGNADVVRFMLDLGFPLDARGDDGATALHTAAVSGSVETARLLLEPGGDLEARDTTWDSTPLVWANVGSGFRLGRNPEPDWVATVQLLIDEGASLDGAWVDGKPPSDEVGMLLRAHGVTH